MPVLLTELEPPDLILESARWGSIAYQEWCRREAIGLCQAGRTARVEWNACRTRVAVVVLPEDADHGMVHV